MQPRHRPVWVRVRGTWRRGLVVSWVITPSGTWECVIADDERPGGPPWQGRYVYDPAAIVPRYGDDPPG